VRDLNLGPDTKKLIKNWRVIDKHEPRDDMMIAACATAMAALLERWLDVAWCWIDACPATICEGPHVRVRYQDDAMGKQGKAVEVVEHVKYVGDTFEGVPFHVVDSQVSGGTYNQMIHRNPDGSDPLVQEPKT
jgi:hypothetical protein